MEAAAKAESEQKRQGYGKDGKGSAVRGKLPEPPKTAEEIWQQNVIGDYLAKYRNDRTKAIKAMEATWSAMEKKEKLMWIKKAAEDQKRYEKELSEIRTPATNTNKKMKFEGEPKKPPMNGYQKFSQELLTGGELNHLNLKDRMVEIGRRWRKVTQAQKDRYKKMAEEQQCQYKINLEAWLKSISPQERAVYKEYTSSKRKSTTKVASPNPKMKITLPTQTASETEDSDDEEDDEEEKANSSDSDDSSGSDSDEESEEEDDADENAEEDDEGEEEDENQSDSSSSSSSEESSDSDSD